MSPNIDAAQQRVCIQKGISGSTFQNSRWRAPGSCTTSFFLCTSPFGTGTYLLRWSRDFEFQKQSLQTVCQTARKTPTVLGPTSWVLQDLDRVTKIRTFHLVTDSKQSSLPWGEALICFEIEFGSVAIAAANLSKGTQILEPMTTTSTASSIITQLCQVLFLQRHCSPRCR